MGKSSLLNRIFGSNRAIVSDIAGTTRDSIDAVMERPGEGQGDNGTLYRFIDTAGIRKKGKVRAMSRQLFHHKTKLNMPPVHPPHLRWISVLSSSW